MRGACDGWNGKNEINDMLNEAMTNYAKGQGNEMKKQTNDPVFQAQMQVMLEFCKSQFDMAMKVGFTDQQAMYLVGQFYQGITAPKQ